MIAENCQKFGLFMGTRESQLQPNWRYSDKAPVGAHGAPVCGQHVPPRPGPSWAPKSPSEPDAHRGRELAASRTPVDHRDPRPEARFVVLTHGLGAGVAKLDKSTQVVKPLAVDRAAS